MGSIATQKLSIATGNKPTLAAPTTSDDYPCGPGCFAVISVGATATTITVVDPRTLDTGLAAPDPAFAGVTGVEKWIPLPSYLGDANGRVTITLSQTANVTVGAVSAL